MSENDSARLEAGDVHLIAKIRITNDGLSWVVWTPSYLDPTSKTDETSVK